MTRSRAADAPGQGVPAPPPDWPLPPRTPETSFFWAGTEQGELRVQACSACGRLRHPPRPGCPACASLDWTYVVSRGTGTVYSFAVHHRPTVPGPQIPYVSAIIELDEGVRLLSNLVQTPFDELVIGLRVRVIFATVTAGLTLPLFVRAGDRGAPAAA
jgi:uncharacterized OB-fold protein